jgi:hydrogenase maturation protease
LRDYFADTHYATPLRALSLLDRLGSLPRKVALIGCEPLPHDDGLKVGLSALVASALDPAEDLAAAWIQRGLAERSGA